MGNELLRKLSAVRKRPSRVVDYLREPRPIVRGGVFANRLGLQLARIAKDEMAWRLRPARDARAIRGVCETLEREGVVVIRDFLPPSDFDHLIAEVTDAEKAHTAKWKRVQFGENMVSDHLLASDFPSTFPHLMRLLRDNRFIASVASAVSRRRLTYKPHVDVQRVSKPDWEQLHTDYDYNQFIHSDRPYRFIKAFFYLNDVDAETAPYTYVPRSHQMFVGARLRYEYAYSLRYSRLKTSRYRRDDAQLQLDKQLHELARDLLNELGLVERPIVAGANTLIISNNQGFHRRGDLVGKRPRRTINLDFKYLESFAQQLYPVLRHLSPGFEGSQ